MTHPDETLTPTPSLGSTTNAATDRSASLGGGCNRSSHTQRRSRNANPDALHTQRRRDELELRLRRLYSVTRTLRRAGELITPPRAGEGLRTYKRRQRPAIAAMTTARLLMSELSRNSTTHTGPSQSPQGEAAVGAPSGDSAVVPEQESVLSTQDNNVVDSFEEDEDEDMVTVPRNDHTHPSPGPPRGR